MLARRHFAAGGPIGLAFLAGGAGAQEVDERVLEFTRSFKARSNPTETLVGHVVTGELDEDDIEIIEFKLDPTRKYLVYGACDDECSALSLQAQDADGNIVSDDSDEDAIPILQIQVGEGKLLKVIVSMDACDDEPCTFGIGIYEVR